MRTGMRIKQMALVAIGAGTIVLAMPGLASACLVPGTNASLRMTGRPDGVMDANGSTGMSGPVGTHVTIVGHGWASGVRMQFTWAGSTISPPMPVDGPDFSVNVVVPYGTVGVSYTIGASQPTAQSAALRGGTGHPFEVTNPDGSVPNNPSKGPAGPQSFSVNGAATGTRTGSGATTPGGSNPLANTGGSTASPTTGAGATASPSTRTGVVLPTSVSVSAVGATTEGPGATPAPGSAQAGTVAVPGTTAAAAPSLRSATGNLWSGFSAGATGLAPSLVGVPAGTGGTSQAGLAMGLLAVGTAALFGGFGVAELRRRRVTVPVGR